MKNISIILGCGFGDEGKGMTTDWVSNLYPGGLTVRFSGGHQCGHNVTLEDGTSHVFASFGAGTLRGNPTYIMDHCVFDPQGILKEGDTLREKGAVPVLYVHRDAPMVTPFDKISNINNTETMNHGSVGVGFGATHQRQEDHLSLVVGDMMHPSIVEIKLSNIRNHYKDVLKLYSVDVINQMEMDYLLSVDEFLKNPNYSIVSDYPDGFDHYVYEGSQGLLLDKDIGFFPHVTRSNTGLQNIISDIADINEDNLAEFFHTSGSVEIPTPQIYIVSRGYATKHGNGYFNNEDQPNFIEGLTEPTNRDTSPQGKFRKGILDLNLLTYGLTKHCQIVDKLNVMGVTLQKNLVVTCLDHLVSPYMHVDKNGIQTVEDETEFVKIIAQKLPLEFRNVFTSHSNVGKLEKINTKEYEVQ